MCVRSLVNSQNWTRTCLLSLTKGVNMSFSKTCTQSSFRIAVLFTKATRANSRASFISSAGFLMQEAGQWRLYCKIEKVTLVNMCTDELVTNINNVNWINNVLIRGALWTINEWLLAAVRKKSNPLLHHTPKKFPFILLLDTYFIATRDRQSDCK